MIQSMSAFLGYFNGIRRRTLMYVETIPNDRLDWAPAEGEYHTHELVRHLAAGEVMYARLITTGEWRYPGHTEATPQTREELIALLASSHDAFNATLSPL